jgi:2-amino-4-hydroxy-6-hydroxymethyldihydropteridine diphosphokinase
MKNRCFISVGSNIEPADNIKLAIKAFYSRFENVFISSVYQSSSVGFDSSDFLNLVVLIESEQISLDEIKAFLYQVENKANRVRIKNKFSSRTLDLDLLTFNHMVDSANNIPHPDILKYPFVFIPLIEVDANFSHPLTGEALSTHLKVGDTGRLVKVEI